MPRRRRLVGLCLVLATVVAGAAAIGNQWAATPSLSASIVAVLPVLVELATAALGAWLIYLFWPRRDGGGAHCKRCGYSQERRGRLAPACPECGAPWLWIGNTRSGRPAGRLDLVGLGVLLCLLAAAASMTASVAPWVFLRLMPDKVLLTQLTVLPDNATTDLWAELSRRNLPQATIDALAEPLLRKKGRDGYLSLPAESILFAAMMRPTTPPDAAARYFASFLSAKLEPLKPVEAGQLVPVRSTATFRGRTLTTAASPRVMVISALYLDDSAMPVEQWEWSVDPEAAPIQERPMDTRLTLEDPGVHRLRQAFWLAVGPQNSVPLGWSGGQPVLPATMSVKDQFEETAEFEVRPRPKPGASGGPG